MRNSDKLALSLTELGFSLSAHEDPERVSDLLGDNGLALGVIRTSNAYAFNDPGAAERPDFRPEFLSPKSRREHQIKGFYQ